jgi:hypothetical protein
MTLDKDIRNNISDIFSAYHFIIRDKFDKQPRNLYPRLKSVKENLKKLIRKYLN